MALTLARRGGPLLDREVSRLAKVPGQSDDIPRLQERSPATLLRSRNQDPLVLARDTTTGVYNDACVASRLCVCLMEDEFCDRPGAEMRARSIIARVDRKRGVARPASTIQDQSD